MPISETVQARQDLGLSMPMVCVLGTGHPSSHSARVIGHKGVIKALQRRGLIGDDRRWTRLGFEVASRVLTGKVKTIDDLHAEALCKAVDGLERVQPVVRPSTCPTCGHPHDHVHVCAVCGEAEMDDEKPFVCPVHDQANVTSRPSPSSTAEESTR